MLLGGDEFRRTQQGNNNAYCQDNELSWYDWRLAQRNAGLQRFVSRLIAFRKAHSVLSAEKFYTDSDIRWFGIDGRAPEWHGRENRIGCMVLEGHGGAPTALCLLFNAALHPCRFMLPRPPGGKWRVAVDTAQESPADAPDPGDERAVADEVILIGRSSVILTC
jgi:isoamylase